MWHSATIQPDIASALYVSQCSCRLSAVRTWVHGSMPYIYHISICSLCIYIYIIHINQILMRVAVRFFVSPLSLCMALYPSIGQAPICFWSFACFGAIPNFGSLGDYLQSYGDLGIASNSSEITKSRRKCTFGRWPVQDDQSMLKSCSKQPHIGVDISCARTIMLYRCTSICCSAHWSGLSLRCAIMLAVSCNRQWPQRL